MPQNQAPVIFVEVEVTCKKCAHKDKIEVPIACDVIAEIKGGALACSLVGDVKQYITECKECGSKEFEVKQRSIRIGSGA